MFKFLMYVILSAMLISVGLAQPSPDLADHQKDLVRLKEESENFTNEGHYNTSWFKHKKTGEIKKFTVLTKLEKQVFYIWNAERLTQEFAKIQQKWEKELEGSDENSDLGKLLMDLVVLRKAHALKYEQALENMFKSFPDSFTPGEKQFILNKVKKYHDDNKLIKRD